MLSQVTGLRRHFPNKIIIQFESERRDPSGIGTLGTKKNRQKIANQAVF